MRRAAWSRPAIRGASLRRAIAVALAALMLAALFSAPSASHAQPPTPAITFNFDDPPLSTPSWLLRNYSVQAGQIMSHGGSLALGSTSYNQNVAELRIELASSVFIYYIDFYVHNPYSTRNLSCFRVDESSGLGINAHSGNCRGGSGGYRLAVYRWYSTFSFYHTADDTRETRTLSFDNFVIYIGATAPTPTPSPTPNASPTPTPSPTPIGGQPPLAVSCRLLGSAATFQPFPGSWRIESGSPARAGRGVLLPQGSSISLPLNLDPNKHYRITGAFTTEGIAPGSWSIALGGAPPFQIEHPTSFSRQILEITPGRYPPGANGYILTLSASTTAEVGLVIENICVSEVQVSAGGSGSGSSGGREGACSACDPPDSIVDIFGIIGWLLCGIRNFFECVFLPFLRGLLAGLLNLLASILSFVEWLIETVWNGVLWIAQIILAPAVWLVANVRNFFTTINNELQVGALASLGNIGTSYARDLPAMLSNALFSIGNELGNVLANARSIFDLIGGLFNLFVRGLAYLITLTPLIIETLISGFNASATAISGSPICTNSSDFLYAVCLGFYVIDNTILSGPAFYLIPIAIGLLVFDTFVWAFQAIRRAFS